MGIVRWKMEEMTVNGENRNERIETERERINTGSGAE